MHIPDAELFDVALELREGLAVGGKLLVSMPESRPDVSPGESRDSRGRLMIVRSVAQLRLLFERLGFELENQWTSEDSTGRAFFVGDAAVSAGRGGAGGWRPGPRGERSRLPARHAAATPPVGRAAPL